MFLSLTNFREAFANFVYPEQLTERRDLARLVNVDTLTGLANRRAFELAQPAAEADPQTAIIALDLNNFGQLNKIAGHKFGDVVLKEFAELLSLVAARPFRLSGDEFVVIVDAADAVRVRDEIEAGFSVKCPGGPEISVSGTIGRNFDEADGYLQTRKGQRKNAS